MKERIGITGASGFIGSHIVREFCSKGFRPVCLLRDPAKTANLKGLDIEVVRADLNDPSSLSDGFRGCKFVIHNASLVADWGDFESFRKVNVLGTENVMRACLDDKIKNVIMTGTVSVYGEENNRTVKNEEYPLFLSSHYKYFLDHAFPSGMNHYRDTKTQAVSNATEFCLSHGMNLTVLEPVWVFGEGEFSSGFYEYIKSVEEGMGVIPGSRKNKFHVVYAGDLARAYFLAWEKKLPGVNRFIIGNPQAQNMSKIYSAFCAAAGLKNPAYLPKAIAYPIAFILELAATILKKTDPPLLTRARVNMFYDNIEYSTEKAERILGFRALWDLETAVRKTVKWYQDNGYLKTKES